MIPAVRDIEIKKGDTFRLFFRIRSANPDGTPGAYINLTGKFPKAQLRKADNSLITEFSATLGDQTAYPGSVLIRLGPVTTAGLAPMTDAKYDVQVSSVSPATITNSDDNYTYLAGSAKIIADVTDNT